MVIISITDWYIAAYNKYIQRYIYSSYTNYVYLYILANMQVLHVGLRLLVWYFVAIYSIKCWSIYTM